jgi:hypothetical protein
VDLGFTRDEALDCPMPQAFALVATNAALDGLEPKEMNYRERETLYAMEKLPPVAGICGTSAQGQSDQAEDAVNPNADDDDHGQNLP